MNTRNTILILLGILVIGALVWYGLGDKGDVLDTNQDGIVDERDGQDSAAPTGEDNNDEPQVLGDSVRLFTPRSGQVVNNPLVVEGEARGWYFEGSFPVKLLDANGKIIAQGPAQAQGEWMTTDWVPFKATLTFSAATNGTGKLVLEKDNPSGLPENDESVSIPVKLSDSETTTIKVYFVDSNKAAPDYNCREVHAVNRVIPKTTSIAKASILELLKGPTSAEKVQGFETNLPSTVTLKDIYISNGTAYVDFSEGMSGGSTRTCYIGSQVRETLLQFPTINKVVITAKTTADPDDVLQP